MYAAARRAGWLIGSHLLTREDLRPKALDTFRRWAIRAKEREVHALRAAGRPEAEVLCANGRSVTLPGLRLLLRDAQSVYDLGRHKLFRPSPRLRAWRRALAERYGQDFLATDTLFPELWARRVLPPAVASRGERSSAWLTP